MLKNHQQITKNQEEFEQKEKIMLGLVNDEKGSFDNELIKDVPRIEQVTESSETIVAVTEPLNLIPNVEESGIIGDDGYEYITMEDGVIYYRLANSKSDTCVEQLELWARSMTMPAQK